MQLKRSTLFNKIPSLIKWLFIKIWYIKSFHSSFPFFIGRKVKIFIESGEIRIGSKGRISDYCEIQSRNSKIEIGDNFNLNSFSRIIAFNKISIGHNVTIAQFVSILDHDHDYTAFGGNLLLNGYRIESIRIGNNVWIGDKVCITKGVSIGDNVIIGAGTIVTKDINSNSIVAGNPSRILKKYEQKIFLVVGFDKTSNGGIASVVKTLANAFELDDEIEYSFLKTTYYKDKSFTYQIIILIKSILKCFFIFLFKKIDIIHIHASYGYSFYRKFIFFILSKLFNKKILFHIHSSKFYEFYLKPNIIIRYVMLNSDLVIVLNQDWLENLVEIYPLANIQKVYNPVKIDNNQKFIPSNRSEYLQVLFMGFYIEEKGIMDLLEVANLFINKPIKFLFCGKGELDGIISNKAKSNPNINNLGWVDGIVKEKLFKESDVLILPSYKEGLPISILEAMKHSLPIISTNIAGIPEQVEHGVNGYLFSPGDIKHLREIINTLFLLHNKDLDKLRENSFLFVKKFSQKTVKKTMKLIYSNI